MHFSTLNSMLCKESIDRVECGPCSQCLCDCFSDNVTFEMALQVAAKVARITLKKKLGKSTTDIFYQTVLRQPIYNPINVCYQ